MSELLRIDEAAQLLALGRSKTYELVLSGVIPSIRIGRSVRVPRARLFAWIEAQMPTPGGEQEPPTGTASERHR